MKIMKLLKVATFLSAWIGLILQTYLLLSSFPSNEYPYLISNLLSYFTIQSNLLVAIAMTMVLRGNTSAKGFKLLAFGAVVNIAITGIIYNLVLRSIWDPKGLQLLADNLLHTITPVLYVVYWILQRNTGKLTFKMALIWLIYPLVYFIYTLVRGPLVNWYPYPFIDVRAIGMNEVLMNAITIAVIFLVVGLIFVALSRALGGHSFSERTRKA
jgi:hypothetical protein